MSDMWREAEDYAYYQGEGPLDSPSWPRRIGYYSGDERVRPNGWYVRTKWNKLKGPYSTAREARTHLEDKE